VLPNSPTRLQPSALPHAPPLPDSDSSSHTPPSASDLSTISCCSCPMRGLCLPGALSDRECADVENLVVRRRLLVRGEMLFQMNEPMHDKLYAVHSGQIKCYQVSYAGKQRITALPAGGELLGYDAIGSTMHATAAQANCHSIVCEFNYSQLLASALNFVPLARRIELLLSKALARQQTVNLMLSSPRAEQKLAIFILHTAWASKLRGGDGVTIEPALSRRDIADYLGLTDATVARLLQRFTRSGCLAVARRRFTLLDAGRLRDIARGDCTSCTARLTRAAT
jgi:CRP/FNR family transcriptional regulator, anaerobic regulatory protein